MDIALLLARLVLATVFVLAGLAKLADHAGSRQTLLAFGVPAPLARPLSVLLPLAELVVALALISSARAWWGALGALALLLLFIGAISYNLARGRAPDCRCFGQLHSSPIGWFTLLRNLFLIALAGFVIGLRRSNAGPSLFAWFIALAPIHRAELIIGVILLGLLALETWGLLETMRQQGRLLVRLESMETQLVNAGLIIPSSVSNELPIGSPAPAFRLPLLYPDGQPGETISLDTLRSGDKPVLLLFSDPDCGPCGALLPEISRWQRDHASKLTLALISRGTVEANHLKLDEHGIMHVLLQEDREVADAYQASGTPAALLVRPDGTIGSPLALGADAIRALITQTTRRPFLHTLPLLAPNNGHNCDAEIEAPGQLPIGEPAPAFALPDLDGRTINLSDFRGQKTLILFWNPGCGFCQSMLADLKAWEANPPAEAPRLLIVSTGTLEANRAPGLRSPILLDESANTGSLFGANGTPMAVLIAADGTIASPVAIGAPAVFALANAGQAQNQPAPA